MITLMSISYGLDPSTIRRKMENTRSFKEGLDEKMFISRQNRHFSFVIIMIKVVFPTLNLDLACKQLCLPPGKGINRRNDSTKEKTFDNNLIIK